MYLSKTDFREFLQCDKNLWLKKNKPDTYVREDPTPFNEKQIREGYEVEEYAREIFPPGTLVEGDSESAARETMRLIQQKKSPIFQATFITESGLLAKIDALVYDDLMDSWTIYEVKSSTGVSRSKDDDHVHDVTFQKLVASEAGLSVDRTYLVHLNKDYRRDGDIEIFDLFRIDDITEDVEKEYPKIAHEAGNALELLANRDIDLSYCSCLYQSRRNHCSSFGVLNKGIPDYSIHDIARISEKSLKELLDMVVMNIFDIPEDFKLTKIQKTQVELEKTQTPIVDRAGIRETLAELKFPLIFFDYETYVSAIPQVDGFGPHQHIPFQVSVHVMESDGELTHHEYLADEVENASADLVEFLVRTVPAEGTIVSWHASFENTRNKEVAEIYPEHSGFLLGLNERTFDLEKIFKDYYHHPDFRGKTSIKKVLPVLCPDFSYKDLDIQSGTEAMESWHRVIFDDLPPDEKARIRESLLEYCKLDTLAMVEIFKHLTAI